MQKHDKIDYTKLLGFQTVGDHISRVDFQDETMGAKLGAKVGLEETAPTKNKAIEFSKLLGFEAVSSELSDGIDFRDDTLGAKLGAKIGDPESGQPEKR